MRLSDYLLIALDSMTKRKLRTILTIFSVVIGSSLITVMVSFGTGAEDFITNQFTSFVPLDTIHVAADPNFGKVALGLGQLGAPPQEVTNETSLQNKQSRRLNETDIKTLEKLPYVTRVDEPVNVSAKSVRLEGTDKSYEADIEAITSYKLEKIKLMAGNYFEEGDQGKAIIAYQYLNVWGFNSPKEALGKKIYLNTQQITDFLEKGQEKVFPFEIVGVAEKSLASTQILLSLKDGKEIARFVNNNPSLYTSGQPIDLAIVKVSDRQYIAKVTQEIRDLGYGAQTPEDMLGTIGQIFKVVEFILSLLGTIALTVASLTVINTLIMSTYERTSEIGLMRALGANRGTIRFLFIFEGSLIGFLGGVIGVGTGYLFGQVINELAHSSFLKDFPSLDISTFPLWLMLLSVGLSTFIALLASFYPANKASRLDPIDALKTE
ncbi:MAG: FtsX-like permease family protein [Patescibacteria group bacterium]|nr:FtsX-like permease family protein [Patescibacteria group bacterium]